MVSDGVFSHTRSVIEKRIFKPNYHGAIAIRTQVKAQDISNLNSNNISLIMGSDAHLVLYPTNQRKEINLVCVIRKKSEERYKTQEDQRESLISLLVIADLYFEY